MLVSILETKLPRSDMFFSVFLSFSSINREKIDAVFLI